MIASDRQPIWSLVTWMTVLVLGVLLLVACLAYVFHGLLILFAGILFGVFLAEVADRVAQRAAIRYRAGLTIVVFLLVTVTGCTAYFLGSQISEQAARFSQQFREATQQLRWQWENQPGWQQWLADGMANGESGPLSSEVVSTAQQAVTITVSTVGTFVLIFFLGFYFAAQPDVYRQGLVLLVPPRGRLRAQLLLDKITDTLWWWIIGRLVGMLIIGIGSTVGLWLMGIPLASTLGVIAGLLNFVPNVGPLIASIPPLLFAWQQGPQQMIYVAAFYVGLQFVESYIITPLIDQRQISLPPGLVLAAQLLFGMLAGFMGLLLATPLTAVLSVIVTEVYVRGQLGEEPPSSADTS